MGPALSVVLPCYNEAGNLTEILSRYRDLAPKVDLELILVDNGSTDDTAKILDQALKSPANRFARMVNIPKNIGYGHGIQAGLEAAQANVVAFSHADLQCSPEDFIAAMDIFRRYEKSGACLVKGRRRGDRPKADRLITWIYNHLAAWLLRIRALTHDANQGLHDLHAVDINAQPKLFPRSFVAPLLKGPKDFTFDLWVLAVAKRLNASIIEFMTDYKARQWGQSKLAANPWVRMKTAMKAFCYVVQLWFS